jgi:hypothetical protein
MEDFKFSMKEPVTDTITGFKGVVIARADYLDGNRIYKVQPKADGQDNVMHDAKWIDEIRLH